jgi:hypothetical protein
MLWVWIGEAHFKGLPSKECAKRTNWSVQELRRVLIIFCDFEEKLSVYK